MSKTIQIMIDKRGAVTNGDVIKAVFPNIKMWGESKDTLDYSLGGMIHRVLKSWWNSPYKECDKK